MQSPFSSSAAKAGIPAALVEHIERVSLAFKQPADQLGDTDEGRDILAVLDDVGMHLASLLTLFTHSVGSEEFTARLYCLQRHGKGENERWRIRHLHAAPLDALMGSPVKLRELINRYSEQKPEKHVYLWLCALPEQGPSNYLAFFRHQSGLEALYLVRDGAWLPMTLSETAIEFTLEAALYANTETRNRWVGLLSATVRKTEASFRAELTPFLAKLNVPELSDEQWIELLRLVYLRREHWEMIAEAGRRMSTKVLHEAEYLLCQLLAHLQQSSQAKDARIERMEKEHQRALKRLRADFEKTQTALKGSESRVARLVKDLSVMTAQRQASPAPAQKDVSFNLALGQFFS